MKEKIINILKTVGIFLLFLYVIISFNETFINYFDKVTSNMLSYLVCLIILIIIFHKSLIKDLKDFSFKKLFKYLVIFIIAFIISYLFKFIINKSTNYLNVNEEGNISLLKSNPIIFIISSAIIVPFTEELIFRENFRNIFKNKWIYSIIVALLFSLVHITSFKTPEIYYLAAYYIISFVISYIFADSKNIYYSVFYHSLNNILAIIIILIGG